MILAAIKADMLDQPQLHVDFASQPAGIYPGVGPLYPTACIAMMPKRRCHYHKADDITGGLRLELSFSGHERTTLFPSPWRLGSASRLLREANIWLRIE